MPRHATNKKVRSHRSPSADRAYRDGVVTHTIDIARSPAFEVRQRTNEVAIRRAMVLTVCATSLWLYDVIDLIRGLHG